MRLWATLILLLVGCGGADVCRCKGAVPGGELDVECGGSTCLDGNGYRCIGANQAVPADDACTSGSTTGGTTGSTTGGTTGKGCVPDCHGQQCGGDGCGGSCGSCDSTSVCRSGVCEPRCQPDCSGKQCGSDGCGGSCGTCGTGQYCNEFNSTDNGYKGMCQATNWCVGADQYADACNNGCCPDAPYHEFSSTTDDFGTYNFCTCRTTCIPADDFASCGKDSDCCSDSTCSLTPGYYGGICTGGCRAKACTASLVNGGCCPSNPYCAGSYGCSSSTGYAGSPCADDAACESGLTCVSGKCTAPCTPSCVGRTCGDNGCGGSCGTCSSGTCTTAGSCCLPACNAKTCGGDGCGGSCGTCSSGTCTAAGSCCIPACNGKMCGDDGCGGSCGSCGTGKLRSGSACVTDPNYCDPVANSGCTTPNQCILLANETTACALAGSGTQGSFCSSGTPCSGGYSCFAGTCRKVCSLSSSGVCPPSSTCNGVSGWATHGACT